MPGLDGQQAETKNVSSAPKQRLLRGQIRAAVAQTNPNSMPHNQRLSPLAFRLIYGLENTVDMSQPGARALTEAIPGCTLTPRRKNPFAPETEEGVST